MSVEPIGETLQLQVRQATRACVRRAEGLFDLTPREIPVRFDLRGRAAGMYRCDPRGAIIRFNPYIFSRHFDYGLKQTVPHEVAHFITDRLFDLRHIKPHGREWRSVMQALGAEPRARGSMDLTGMPLRRQKRHAYRCKCTIHQLSTCRHNRILKAVARYHCRNCGSQLVAMP